MIWKRKTTDEKLNKIKDRTKEIEAKTQLQEAKNKLYAMKRVRAKQRWEYIKEASRSVFGPASEEICLQTGWKNK